MSTYDLIADHIERTTGNPFSVNRHRVIGGGCINRAVLLEGAGQRYFVKLNQSALVNMFEAEAEGLQAIQATQTVRVPAPICWGTQGDNAYLVLEYIEMSSPGMKSYVQLGSSLAALHQTTTSQFGWHLDNTIGSTPQINTYTNEWVEFLREYRLGYQLRLAADNRLSGSTIVAGENLLTRLDDFFGAYVPVPCLLHGDLWGGNFSADREGSPVVFDPATYFGDREADVAMTELFGGFDPSFYASYENAWTLDEGYRVRKLLYNLYHVLNHFNLFGGGYAAQAQNMIHELLAELG
ncbi:MAG: fructosamine kinase family protein [Arenicellales bacterium]|nr:fructosamine kinase family protein [Arenicellales bacterium]